MLTRHYPLVALFILNVVGAAFAMPDPPGQATVVLARSETILVPQGLSAPKLLYPQGRVDYDVVERLLDAAVFSLTGAAKSAGWRALFPGRERVGIIVEAGRYPVQLATVECLIDALVDAGSSPAAITVFSADERDLFMAGFNINRDERSVRVMGTDAEGFRGGMSRIVTDYCDVLINLGTLQADADLGFSGCVANTLCCVPTPKRLQLRREPEQVGSVAAMPAIRQKLRLNLLEAYLPLLDVPGAEKVTRQYGGLLAGTDPVAVDAVGRKILEGCRGAHRGQAWPLPGTADYLQPARDNYRLGQSDLSRITLKLQGYDQDAFVP